MWDIKRPENGGISEKNGKMAPEYRESKRKHAEK